MRGASPDTIEPPSGDRRTWRCLRCGTLLGIRRGGQLHLRLGRAQYLVALPAAAQCRNCAALNRLIDPAGSTPGRAKAATQLFRPNLSYRIEAAGCQADGTPLVAVFTDLAETVPLAIVPLRNRSDRRE